MAQGSVRWEQTVAGRRRHGIQNNLPNVGHLETALTRDVPGDQQVGIDFRQKPFHGRSTCITSPKQSMDSSSRPKVLLVVSLTLKDSRIKVFKASGLRQTMAEENTVGSPQCQWD